MDITINDGRQVKTPALPFSINGEAAKAPRSSSAWRAYRRGLSGVGPAEAGLRLTRKPRRRRNHYDDNPPQRIRKAARPAGASLLASRSIAQARQASLAYGPATAVYSLGPIADAKGFLKAEGLDLKLVVGNAGTHGRQSLAAAQALFAHGDASHPLQLSTRGKKAKIVLATQMISSIGNIVVRGSVRRRDRQRREARRLQASERRQAGDRSHGHRLGYVDVRDLHV